MTEDGLSWRIEETCFNAFPSLRQVLLGNWLMRFSAGLSRRANSVNPLRPEGVDLAAAITAAEALYRAQGQPTIFRVPSIVDPALDRELAARVMRARARAASFTARSMRWRQPIRQCSFCDRPSRNGSGRWRGYRVIRKRRLPFIAGLSAPLRSLPGSRC